MDAAPMCLDDVPDDREPETGRPSWPLATLHEPLENPLALVSGDSWASVRDDDPNRIIVRDRVDRDGSATGCVSKRVRHQVRKRPGQRRRVPRDCQPISSRLRLEGDFALRCLEREHVPDPREHRPKVDGLTLTGTRHRSPARHLEQPVRYVLEPLEIAPDGDRELARPAGEGG